jgi:drug/metabolite transporter (DMT)-like permease
VLLSVKLSASFIVVQPTLLHGRDPAAVTAVQLGAGGLAALPVAIVLEGAPPAPATAGPPVAVLALAVTGTALAFWLFAWAQSRVAAEFASAFVNLEPLVGALTGVVAFGDAFGAAQLAGGTAILAGIALGAAPRRRRRGRPDRPCPSPPNRDTPRSRARGRGAARSRASALRRPPSSLAP